jgi:hypothetical protein
LPAIFPAAGAKVHDSGQLFAGTIIPHIQLIDFAALNLNHGDSAG